MESGGNMTLVEFSREVGVGIYYIKQKMTAGEIPYEIKPIGKNFNYYIDPEFVPIFKERLKSNKKSKPRKYTRSNRGYKITPLGKACKEIEQYNKEHGVNLTYGQAVAKGIIEG